MTSQTPTPLLIDGGLSAQLKEQGLDLNFPLWTAHHLIHNPLAIRRAHLAYLNAGAQLLITSSYQASIEGFRHAGFTEMAAQALLRSTISLAQSAVHEFSSSNDSGPIPLIAASLGPYGAILGDGSEYHGRYQASWLQVEKMHALRIAVLDEMVFDWYACETLPSLREAEILAHLLAQTSKKVWISFTCRDGMSIADGTSIEECIRHLATYPHITALGINCTAPEYVLPLMQKIQPLLAGKQMVIYPNSGGHFDASTKVWRGSNDHVTFMDHYTEWMQLNPDIIGGCCRIGTSEIALLKANYCQNKGQV